MNSIEWFKNAKFGLMFHFGLYTQYLGVYKGKHVNEWARQQAQIGSEEYHNLCNTFYPYNFDADEWVSLAKDAGAKYIVVTAKHHDGFALYDSKVSDFNIVKATPFGRDMIKELSDSCKKYGIKLGIYYSHDMDWDEEGGGGFIENKYCNPANNVWDFEGPFNMEKFQAYLDNKAMPQVKEILENYEDLCQIWFDNPWTVTKEQSHAFYDLVKSIQPNCLVSERVGNDKFDIKGGGDNCLDMETNELMPNEVPATINKKGDWDFVPNDTYMDADEIHQILKDANKRGISLLLNIGPKPDGTLPEEAKTSLRKLGEMLNDNI